MTPVHGWLAIAIGVGAAACGATPRPPVVVPAPPPAARIEVAAGECPPAIATEDRLRAVLAAHRAEHADLVIRVAGAPAIATGGHELRLVVVRGTGAVGLDRSYPLAAADCASATELVALGVERFLSAFPEWAEPPRPVPPPPPPTRWRDVHLTGAVNSIWVPLGVDAQVGGIVDWGGDRDRLGGSVVVRASVPQAAGTGHFQQTALLAGLAWRHRAAGWSLRVEARGGALLVSGIGFTRNDRDVLPWWEGAVFAGRATSWGALGVEVAATGLRHRAVTRDGLIAEDIPLFRFGISGELRLGSQKP
jgi:hypothetical protein